jgi:DNA transformation protein
MVAHPYVDHCLELLAPPGRARARRMFGGHGVYVDEVFVAIVADEQLYLKADAATQPAFAAAGGRPFVYEGKGRPMQMGFWCPPAEAFDSPAAMAPWCRLALEAALRARTGPARRR